MKPSMQRLRDNIPNQAVGRHREKMQAWAEWQRWFDSSLSFIMSEEERMITLARNERKTHRIPASLQFPLQ